MANGRIEAIGWRCWGGGHIPKMRERSCRMSTRFSTLPPPTFSLPLHAFVNSFFLLPPHVQSIVET